MYKRFFSAILCALFLFAAFPVDALAASVPPPVSDDVMEAVSVLSGLNTAADSGGVYLTENATKVVVLLIKATEARKNEIRAMVKNPDILVFQNAKYSYTELMNMFSKGSGTNGKFELIGTGVDIQNNCVVVEVYYGGEAAARAYYKKYGDRVKVVGADALPKGDEYDPIEGSSVAWLKEVFPAAKEITTTDIRFVFSGAPKVTKTRAVLNKQGESLTLYRFANKKDYEKCKAMIRGTSLVYGGNVVYVDTEFATTYFYNKNSNMLALYCGATRSVFETLQDRNFHPAGGLGGFFARRNGVIYKDATTRVDPNENTPDTPKALAKISSAVVRAIVKSAPSGLKEGAYTLELRESIRGKLGGTITVTAMPGVMEKGKSYIVFLKEQAVSGGKKALVLTDNAYFSVFELTDKGYVLPVREYGMTKPVTQTAFIKGL